MSTKRFTFVRAALALLPLLAGCQKPAPTAAAAAAPVDPAVVTARPNLLEKLKLAPIEEIEFRPQLTVAARIEVDETRVTRVGSPVMGRLTSLGAQPGEQVHKGQLLATLHSPQLSDAQLYYLKALSQSQLAQRTLERTRILVQAGVTGSAEEQRREAELSEATAELNAALDQLTLLGMPAEAIETLRKTRAMNSVSRVMAASEGTVLERRVAPGQVVQPADTIYEVADLSRVWLVADVPENDAGTLAVGQAVRAEIAALPGTVLEGRLSFVSAMVNPETRTVRARLELANPHGRFKPAMLATMTIQGAAVKKRAVPVAAVVRDGNTEGLFVRLAADKFQLRTVRLGEETATHRVVLEGIRPDEAVVVAGAFHLNNERRRRNVRGGEGE